jgi:mono/diheme cytochrome c family protein
MNKTFGVQGAGAVPAGLALAVLLALLLVGCGNPQPLPVAPTPIPTLPPVPPPAAVEPTAQPGAESISFPGEPPSAPDGGAVYSTNCATCHGADGKGLVEGARDFNDLDYMRAAAPADFYASITNGKGKMPAFKDQLSDGDRWNATYYLWHWSVPDAMLAEGDKIFQTNCASCHGADGSGAIPQAPKLTDVEFISSYPAAQFFKSVSGGKGIMPAWQGRLSDDERWAAVERVRTFAYQPAAGGAPPSQPTQGPPTQAPPTQAPEPTAAPSEAPTAVTAPQPTEAPAPTQTPAATASSGDAAAGKQAWDAKPCLGCHGANAEGGFGPKLAGTALTLAEVQKTVRNGRTGTAMAAFGESQITDKELIDIYAWLQSR